MRNRNRWWARLTAHEAEMRLSYAIGVERRGLWMMFPMRTHPTRSMWHFCERLTLVAGRPVCTSKERGSGAQVEIQHLPPGREYSSPAQAESTCTHCADIVVAKKW